MRNHQNNLILIGKVICQSNIQFENRLTIKGTVRVILSDPPSKDVNARSTMESKTALSD